jgi:hypothetical protein
VARLAGLPEDAPCGTEVSLLVRGACVPDDGAGGRGEWNTLED